MAVEAKSCSSVPTANQLELHTTDPYQLYFKIIEASQIEGKYDKTSNFTIKFWLETFEGVKVPGSSGKTRTYKSSLQPIWNEEWVIPRICGAHQRLRLRFILYECFSILPNSSVGEAAYDLDQSSTDGIGEAVLDLVNGNTLNSTPQGVFPKNVPSSKVCGRIKILIHKTPLYELPEEREKRKSEIEKRCFRLPTLRLILEKLSYFPGEVVRGLVICNIGMPVKLSAINLKFVGETIVGWREIDDREYASHMDHVNHTVKLLENDGQGEDIVQGKQLCFPFSFALPHHIPPSFVEKDGSTSYRIMTYLDPCKIPEHSQIAYIEVLARYRSSIPSVFALGQSNTATQKSDVVKLSIASPSLWETGSQLPIRFSISNPHTAKKSIHSVYACFIQDTFFHGQNFQSWSTQTSTTKITTVTMAWNSESTSNEDGNAVLPILPGQQREITLLLEIPVLTPPSIPEQLNPLMSVQYRIEGAVLSEGNTLTATKTAVEVPIVVSRRAVLPPRIQNAPENIMRDLPTRVNGDHAIRTNGEIIKNTSSPRHHNVEVYPNSSTSTNFPPIPTLPEIITSPRATTGKTASSIDPSSLTVSPSQRLFVLTGSDAEILPLVKTTGDQNRQKCLILTTQPCNRTKSHNSSLTTFNDAPITYCIDPRLVSLRRSILSRAVSDPLQSFEQRQPISNMVLNDKRASGISISALMQQVMAEQGNTKCEPSHISDTNDFNITIYCNSDVIPSFTDFFPPRPFCAWTDDIPISAMSLPDFSNLDLLKNSNPTQADPNFQK